MSKASVSSDGGSWGCGRKKTPNCLRHTEGHRGKRRTPSGCFDESDANGQFEGVSQKSNRVPKANRTGGSAHLGQTRGSFREKGEKKKLHVGECGPLRMVVEKQISPSQGKGGRILTSRGHCRQKRLRGSDTDGP